MEKFTTIECEVLNALLSGHTKGAELAQQLYMCRQTVYYHLNNLFYKTSARNKTDLVLWLWRNGWQIPVAPDNRQAQQEP